MNVSKVNLNTTTTRAGVIAGTMKRITDNMDSPLSKFLDNTQPMVTNWYHINKEASMYGKGFKDSAGPYEGGIKYTLIHNYLVYGYNETTGVDEEEGENLHHRFKPNEMTLIHTPGSLRPSINDRVSFAYEGHKYLYMVKSSVPVTFNNKPFIKTEITKCNIKLADYYEDDFKKDNLIAVEYDFIEDNVGLSGKQPFLPKDASKSLDELEKYKDELMNRYNDFFYDEDKNVYITPDPQHMGFLTYTPLLVDLQMEFRPMWTDGINTILTHETLVNRLSKYNYLEHVLRKFLLRKPGAWDYIKENGIRFTPYYYRSNMGDPMYKIQSYLNDGNTYLIYDYYNGEDIYQDVDRNQEFIVTTYEDIMIPEKYHEIMDKYYKDNMDSAWLIDWLDKYEFRPSFITMLMNMIIIYIIENQINGLNSGKLNSMSSMTALQ